MNVIKITHFDIANGEGIRTVLWVSGCEHHCKGCHNQFTWDDTVGEPYNESVHGAEILKSLSPSFIKGVTFSGGDPFYYKNEPVLAQLARKVKECYPTKDIWCYTGYLWEEIKHKELTKYLDVLVDGRFIQELKDLSLPFCGSKNQRIIDVQKSLQTQKIVIK